MNELSVMTGSGNAAFLKECFPEGTEIKPGDTKLIWNRNAAVEVDAAKTTFDKLIKAGYLAFRAEGSDGHQGSAMKTWDADAERIIMIPKIQGGRQ